MQSHLTQQLTWLSPQPHVLQGMLRGLEKETLRMSPDGMIAQTPHPEALGSALTHPHITTDYSEALLELITPATASIAETLGFLDDLHTYVYRHLGEERLWLNSMPCMIGLDDEQIPLAQYGTSNIGRLKTLYRHGLGVRYGRKMQTIAGIHYNLSFPDRFWDAWQTALSDARPRQDFINEKYFALVRNFQRHSFLLLYLLGASPAVCACFLVGRQHSLQNLGSHTLYQPHATSLRMSRLGYQNTVQRDLHVSYNRLDHYIRDLSHAIHTPYPAFEQLGVKNADGDYVQMNTNVLQIENEYYGLIRPKRTTLRGEKPTQALRSRGVEYVELRCVDLNPFAPTGIDSPTAHFLEVFALHSLLYSEAPFTPAEYAHLGERQETMVERGREPGLQLLVDEDPVAFADVAGRLLAEMADVAALLDQAHQTRLYSAAILEQQQKLGRPEQTYAARVLDAMKEHGDSFFAFGKAVAEEHRDLFRARNLSPEREALFRQQTADSLQAQADLEAADTLGFDDFLAAYNAA
ncbi:glutamate-cysteine ligase [Fluviicoccus keumensis]|uniref:Glutamate--cysteine ligase n=1 Tax=Fluviicoccus keumensis TaxID=1435465 RepID=A0A4Q7ZBE4_9GAMM|nr:glutamate--cysteine ligase [Fluviicoccus keumensis]RZU47900.1 glutamate-cysteine ligase [Fluviicoccus keumensis]